MSFQQDIIYALRAMRKSPGATAIAIVALALGIGANTAVFSVVDAALLNSAALRSLRDPGRLVMLWEKNPAMMAFLAERMPVALQNIREWKRQSRSFEGMTAVATLDCSVGASNGGERPARVEAMQVEPNFFALLGIRPEIGRTFTEDEARTAADRVVMLSGALYRRRFGNDRNPAGKTIRVNGTERVVIGALPEKFQLPAMWEGFDQKKPEVWIPLDTSAAKTEQELWPRSHLVFARLRPGATLAQARSEMGVIGTRLQKQFPEPNKGFGINVFPIAVEHAGPELRRGMFVLQVAVGFVLLIACANVANLLLARAVAREREIAIRLALGARRRRIVRQMLTESVLLGLAAGAAGLLLAFWSLGAISALAPDDIHAFHDLRLDLTVLGFTVLISVATGLIFGLAPALHATRQDLNQVLGKGSRSIGGGPQWLRGGMVVAQVALALVLLTGAGLMIRSLRALNGVDPGFQADHLLTMQVSVLDAAGVKQKDMTKVRLFGDRLLERVLQLPGVKAASLSDGLPMERVSQRNYGIEGVQAKTKDWLITNYTDVSETFFDTMVIPIKCGRGFTRAETEANRPTTVVVSESFARENWPNQDALGKVVLMPAGDKPDLRLTVIGVVGDTHQLGPDNHAKPEVFVPSRVYPDINMAVRTAGDPMALAPALEKAVWSIDPQQPVQQIRSMQRVLYEWVGGRRFYMTVLGGFAGLALLLASLGLYGVLAYVVTLRTRELGIRAALGAGPREILQLVMSQGLRLTGLGIMIGLAGALLLTRLLEGLIFGVSASDPVTFVAVTATLSGVALAASYVPARRAARIDPMEALRVE